MFIRSLLLAAAVSLPSISLACNQGFGPGGCVPESPDPIGPAEMTSRPVLDLPETAVPGADLIAPTSSAFNK